MTEALQPAKNDKPPLIGVVSFSGALPVELAECAERAGQPVFMIGFRGFADPAIERWPHDWVKLGQIGSFLRVLRRNAIDRIVIIGSLTRPALRDLSFDWRGLWDLPQIIRILRGGGDDSALRKVVRYIEKQGVAVVGISDIAPDLLAGEGRQGRIDLIETELRNAAIGFAVLEALSAFDVGQACIVLDGRPVAIEGVEGTDAMIRRVTELRANGRLRVDGRRGLLIKAAKRNQDLRVDLPTIGPRTIELAAEAKLAGIVIESGKSLIAERSSTLALADRLGLSVVGSPRG